MLEKNWDLDALYEAWKNRHKDMGASLTLDQFIDIGFPALIAELRASRRVVEAAKECAINAGWDREHYMIAEERYRRLWDALHELDGSWLVNVRTNTDGGAHVASSSVGGSTPPDVEGASRPAGQPAGEKAAPSPRIYFCDTCGHTAREHRDRLSDSALAPCRLCSCSDFDSEAADSGD